ncbi:hypothetical protein CROQUDRAFT_671995 [Cronartium quercuum f. sp. fusiforme G11]|uniref:C2H2-type domain-containing protein n=1 Tax=Cronartium quercuum f. sp. fusiforme G11 TaxID=708437 RepID=A0A9P6NJ32_9BASI|nr:hypothetical protein CROQUDRAFT_671995 [Cronartium quercuum f. sp. fusiforme G11]
MSDVAGGWAVGETRPRSPSPGRGGRFEDGGGRRSPPTSSADRWPHNGQPGGTGGGGGHRGRSPDFGRKRRRDESPPMSRDRYIPNYDHRANHGSRHAPGSEMFEDPYRRGGGGGAGGGAGGGGGGAGGGGGGGGYWEDRFTGSPERGMSGPGRGPPRSHMPAPSELPHLVSFRYFADYMRSTSPSIAEDKDKLAEQWRRYRQDYSQKQLVGFFEENKTKPWFREKYMPGPELDQLRAALRKKGREGKLAVFLKGLEAGEFDILNYDYQPSRKRFSGGKPVSISAEAEAETETKATTTTNGENGMKTEPTDPQPEPRSSPAIADQQANDPAAMEELAIKSESPALPPLESEVEVKVEEDRVDVKKEEPALTEDFDEPEPEPEPDYEPGPGDETCALGKLIGESMRGKGGADDIVMLPAADNQLFIKSISPDISRAELENHCKQAEGFDYLALSDPHTGKKLHRVGWVSFVPGTDMKAAEEKLSESRINNFTLHMMRAERPAFQKLRITPGIMSTPSRITRDLAQARKLAGVFEQEYLGSAEQTDEKRGSVAIEDRVRTTMEEEEESAREKKTLDLYLYYLRTVFNACYYCACVCDFQEELLRRCAKHVRRPVGAASGDGDRGERRGAPPKANESSWARTLDERLKLLLDPADVDPREFGGEKVDDEIRRLCQPQITDEGAGKFRCKNCSKLFKAMNFIEKHIISKHGEVINQDSIERIKYLNNYILDPSHTTPQIPNMPEYAHNNQRPNHNGLGNSVGGGGMGAPNGMMNMSGAGMPTATGPEYGMGGYGTGIPMMGAGGPYAGYGPPPQMFAAYGPYPGMPMFGGPPGGMMGGGPTGYGPPYYMGPGPGGYTYPQHAPVYPSMGPMTGLGPHAQPPARSQTHNTRRLGDRISRQFAGQEEGGGAAKRSRRTEEGVDGASGVGALVSADPRSKTVLAYNDLDVTPGDEIVLNY